MLQAPPRTSAPGRSHVDYESLFQHLSDEVYLYTLPAFEQCSAALLALQIPWRPPLPGIRTARMLRYGMEFLQTPVLDQVCKTCPYSNYVPFRLPMLPIFRH